MFANGEAAEVDLTPIFNGYSVDDPAAIFASSFRTETSSGSEELSVLGMVHFPTGHHTLGYSRDQGLHLARVEHTEAPEGHKHHRCDVEETKSHDDDGSGESNVIRKRDIETVSEDQDNGAFLTSSLGLVCVVFAVW